MTTSTRRRSALGIGAITLGLAGSLLTATPAHAIDAGNAAQLAAAIDTANGSPGPDEIVLLGDITLTEDLPSITDELTVRGDGATVFAEGFTPFHSTGTALTIRDVTVNGPRSAVWAEGGSIDIEGMTVLAALDIGVNIDNATTRIVDSDVRDGDSWAFTINNGGLVDSSIELSGIEITDNSNWGAHVAANSGLTTISGLTTLRNSLGIELDFNGTATIEVDGIHAEGNWGSGVLIWLYGSANLTADRVTSLGNGNGMATYLDGTARVTVRSSAIADNDEYGFYTDAGDGARVELEQVAITGNASTGDGAGISATLTDASLAIDRTTIAGNVADGIGGGLAVSADEASTIEITSSTIAGNTATDAAAMSLASAGLEDAILIEHTTVADNTSTGPDAVDSIIESPDTTIRHSILAGGATSLALDDDGAAIDFTLVETPGAFVADALDVGTGNQSGVDPMLAPLADNGGGLPTMLPESGSPIVDAGDPAFAPPPDTDQRGEARVVGDAIDLGAVEHTPAPPPLPATGADTGWMAPLALALLVLGSVLRRRVRTTARAE